MLHAGCLEEQDSVAFMRPVEAQRSEKKTRMRMSRARLGRAGDGERCAPSRAWAPTAVEAEGERRERWSCSTTMWLEEIMWRCVRKLGNRPPRDVT